MKMERKIWFSYLIRLKQNCQTKVFNLRISININAKKRCMFLYSYYFSGEKSKGVSVDVNSADSVVEAIDVFEVCDF